MNPPFFWLRGALAALLAGMLCACSSSISGARAPGADLIITNVRVLSSPDAPIIERASIMLRGDRIVSIQRGPLREFGPGVTAVDGNGATALAGFWNMHVHLVTPVFLEVNNMDDPTLQLEIERAFTRWGFTTVFDLASTMDVANRVRARVSDGSVLGPRILTVGAPFYPEGATPVYARPLYQAYGLPSAEVSSAEGAVARVQFQFGAGANGVKLFTGAILSETDVAPMQAAIVEAVVAEADRLDIPVFAHPTNSMGLAQALRGGVDILAHAAPLDGPWELERAQEFADAGIALIPTLGLFEAHPHPATPVELAVQQTRAFYEAGGVVLFGTDAGFTDHFDTGDELRLMEDAIGWRGVVASLTTAPAAEMRESHQRGRIEPGYFADIVLVRGDPASDIEALSRVELVVRDGTVIYRGGFSSGAQ